MKKNIKILAIVLSSAFLLLNALAFMHAYKMTHFAAEGLKPVKPENMTFAQKCAVMFTGVTVPKPEASSVKPDFKYETIHFAGYKNIMLEAWLAKGKNKDSIVLMFHGYIESKIQLIPEAQEFLNRGYSVMLVDFYGSGGSQGKATSVGYYEAEDVKAAYDKAKELGYKDISIFAVSMGSAAAMRAISQYNIAPDVLMIEGPFAGLLDTVRRRFDLLKAPSWPFAEIFVFWGSIIEGYNGFTYNPASYAKNIKIPVLLLHGGRDKRVSVAQAEKIFDNLQGVKKMVVFPQAGHLSYLKEEPVTWKKEVFNFMVINKKIIIIKKG